MSLLDAPEFDEAREKRKQIALAGGFTLFFVLLIAFWFVAGRPIDWPWNWQNYLFARSATDKFLTAVEANDLKTAYGIWVRDKDWQQHPQNFGSYKFDRFQDDWSSTSPENDYGSFQSHKIVLAGRYGNGILVASLINGRKSKALNLDYNPKTGTLDFAPPGVELYLGP